jgi:hypothetical protein
MKLKLILLAMICGLFASAQGPSTGTYTPVNTTGYNWIRGYFRGLHIPAGGNVALQVGQWPGAGAVYVDTVGDDKGFYYLMDGTFQRVPLSSEFNEIDVFLVGGQSNARGLGDSAQSPNPQPGTVYKYDGTFQVVTNEIITPIGPIPVGARGSAWPSFGINYNRLTGRRVCIIPYGIDGSGQMTASNSGFGDWGPAGTLFNASVAQVNAGLAAIISAGFSPKFRGVLWCQGENDARKINDATITSTQYRDTLTWMISQYRANFGSAMPFYIYQTGTEISVSDIGYLAVRTAQQTVVDADPLRNKMISTNQYDFVARSLMVDNIHYNQTALNEMGTVGAEQVVNGLDLQWMRSGTSLSYMKGRVGVGVKLPTHPFQVVGSGESAKFTSTGGGANGVAIEQTGAGSSDAATLRFYNNAGLNGQLTLGSTTNGFVPNGFAFHCFTGVNLIGSNSGTVELFTGVSGPQTSNTKLRILNNGKIGIGSNITPHTSTLVDMVSTSAGLRIPTMTGGQMTSISSPATGLLVWCTDSAWLCQYSGSVWQKVSGSGAGGGSQDLDDVMSNGTLLSTGYTIDAGGNSYIIDNADQIQLLANDNIIVESGASTEIKATDNVDLYANGTMRLRIDGSDGSIKFGGATGVIDVSGRIFATQFISNAGSGTVFASSFSNVGYSANPITISTAVSDILFSPASTERMRLTPGGNFGIGTAAPISMVHSVGTIRTDDSLIVAGHTKLNGLTTTIGSSGTPMSRVISGTGMLDFGSTAASSSSDLTITVTGAAVGDAVFLGVPAGSVTSNTVFFAWVSATNTVTVRCMNNDIASPVDPASGAFRASVVVF